MPAGSRPLQDFIDPPQRAPGCASRELVERKELRFLDFKIWTEWYGGKSPQDETGNMVAREILVVEIHTVQLGFLCGSDGSLLLDLAYCRFINRLAPFHPAAWHEPARRIGMPHKQNLGIVTQHHGARTESEASELAVERLNHQQLRRLEQGLCNHASGYRAAPTAPSLSSGPAGTMPDPMSTDVTVRPVRDKSGTRAFLDVPFSIYGDDPNWVAPLYLERFEHLDPKKNPYFQHADVELFVAEKDGKPVGRISAQLCKLRSERYKDGVGQFGFLEAVDDPAVFGALFEAAMSWLKQRGATRIQGPFSFSINDEMGLLIDGFDAPPSMMMGHGKRYYQPRVEQQGFAKAKDVIAYDYFDDGNIPRAIKAAHDKAAANPDVIIRPLNKKKLMDELEVIVSISNDAWSDNWGFVPWTQAEMVALGNNLKMLVTGDYIAIAEYRGEPVAMAVSLPNINEWIAGLNGRLLPFGWAKLAWSMFARPPGSVRMPLMGLRKRYHGSALGAACAMAAIAHVRKYHASRGTLRGELSWILEDNLPVRRMIESFGGKPYKTYRIYEKAIT